MPVELLLLVPKSMSSRRLVCVALEVHPFQVLTVLSLVSVLLMFDSVVDFFCLRGALPVPYSMSDTVAQ